MAYVGTPIDTQNQFQSLQGKRFSGDASTTAFTLDIAPSSVFDIEVFVENVRQDPNSAYGISGTTLTFTGAPPSGTNNIYVVHQAKAVGTIEVLDGAITTAKLGADAVTEAKIADDAVESEHLNDNIISGQTALTSSPADTDELLISDAGTLKRIDVSLVGGKNTPAFEAYNNGDESISNATWTKMQVDTERFDTDSNFASNRFTPTTAGKYFVYGRATLKLPDYVIYSHRLAIYKNGSLYSVCEGTMDNNNMLASPLSIQSTVDMNGSSDYVEIYAYLEKHGGSDGVFESDSPQSIFGAFRIIGA